MHLHSTIVAFRRIRVETLCTFATIGHLLQRWTKRAGLVAIKARQAALEACKPGSDEAGQSAPRKLYQRSRKVAHYVLMRSQGACESCERPAPFMKKDGTPYLEPHHVNRLTDGGLDHPRYVAAVCPSCHREIHSGVNGAIVNDRLKRRLEAIEGDVGR